ncbi:MAG: hypothetical protein PVJ84_17640 [Desulfobacteraceae bacterium]|jgi:hypothetical protein
MTSIIAKLLKANLNESVSQFFERRNVFWGIARYNLIRQWSDDFNCEGWVEATFKKTFKSDEEMNDEKNGLIAFLNHAHWSDPDE